MTAPVDFLNHRLPALRVAAGLALVLAAAAAVAQTGPAAASAPATAPATAPRATPASAAQSGAVASAPAASAPTTTTAVAPTAAPTGPALEARIQQAKLDLVQLNRDLLILEEELLFPANTQLAVFVSMDVGQLFQLESVQLKLNDQVVATHLYTPHEVKALHRGAVQRLHLGHLKSGRHVLTAFFTGQGPHTRDYRRAATVTFEKGSSARFVELRIEDVQAKLQPEFRIQVLP